MEHRSRSQRHGALALLCLAHLMSILDISIINIAIPSIQKDLGLSTSLLQWPITAYVLTYGGFLLVGGRLGDLFGRRRIFLLGLGIFTFASAMGGVATNAGMLLMARAGQGLGGAILTPNVMSYVAGLYREGAERNWAMSILGTVNGAAFALGLVLGGLLTSTLGWRWTFFINLPIGLLVILLSLWWLPETEREHQPINLPGAILATASLGMITFTLSQVEELGLFSPQILGLFLCTGLLVFLFVMRERSTPHRLIPAGLFRHRSLIRALIGSTTFGLIIGPSTLILTLYLQDISQLDPLRTGLAFLPQEAAVFLAANLAGRAVTRYGTRHVLASGVAAFGLGAICLTQMSIEGGYFQAVLPGLVLLGFGIGSVTVAGSIAATEGVPPLRHGVSTGLWNTGNQIGTALGLSILTSTAAARTDALLRSTPHIDEASATVAGFRFSYVIATVFALVGIGSLLFLRSRTGGQEGDLPLEQD